MNQLAVAALAASNNFKLHVPFKFVLHVLGLRYSPSSIQSMTDIAAQLAVIKLRIRLGEDKRWWQVHI